MPDQSPPIVGFPTDKKPNSRTRIAPRCRARDEENLVRSPDRENCVTIDLRSDSNPTGYR